MIGVVSSNQPGLVNPSPPLVWHQSMEALVGAENWHQERERLLHLMSAIDSGQVTHIDEAGLRQLQATNPENVAALKERIAILNARIGDKN